MSASAVEIGLDRNTKPQRERLGPTLLACGLVAALFAWAVGWQTDGLEHWTFESRRVALAEKGLLQSGSLSLRDPEHRRVNIFAGEDAIYLVDFVYTSCLTVCRVLGSEFTQMQNDLHLSGTQRVRLLSLSIDPDRDDEPALAAFKRLHRNDPRLWTVAAPAQTEAGARLRRQWGVIVIPDGAGGFIHNGDIHLVDGSGRLLAIYDYTEWRSALDAALRRTPPAAGS